jgi:hypothetical protein
MIPTEWFRLRELKWTERLIALQFVKCTKFGGLNSEEMLLG